MRVNHFAGFGRYMEQDAPPPDPMGGGMPPQQPQQPPQKKNVKTPFMSTVRSQIHVPIEQWYTSTFEVENTCMGSWDEKTQQCDGDFIREPTPFNVVAHDDYNVTIRSVPNAMSKWASDLDKVITKTKGSEMGESREYTIPRKRFDQLVKPKNYQGADYQTASQTAMAPK